MPYIAILICLILINIIGELFIFIGGSQEIFLYVIYYPVVEETLKSCIVVKFGKNLMRYIFWFASLEVIFAKIPVLFDGSGPIDHELILYAIFPFIFHIGSGLFYFKFINYRVFSLIIMIIIHACLNASVEIEQRLVFFLYLTLSIMPYAIYRLLNIGDLR